MPRKRKTLADIDATIIRLVEQIVQKLALQHEDCDERWGGCFMLMERDCETPRLATMCVIDGRKPNLREYERCYRLAHDQSYRLDIPEHAAHESSWQSRKPDSFQHGGAIRAGVYRLSFNGISEPCDETVVLTLAREKGWISAKTAKRICAISGNTAFAKFWKY